MYIFFEKTRKNRGKNERINIKLKLRSRTFINSYRLNFFFSKILL